ncbi:MAG TPA: hypothetical protein VFA09_02955 [Ktedonobacteraceae bacterium]|jgi:hypothetical protein|nr:hypothetical protein [Ktedonobacteraceae bacterium]
MFDESLEATSAFDYYATELWIQWSATHLRIPPRIPNHPMKDVVEVSAIDAILALTDVLEDASARQEIRRMLTPLAALKREQLRERFEKTSDTSKHRAAFDATRQEDGSPESFPGLEEWWFYYGMLLMEQRAREQTPSGGKVR